MSTIRNADQVLVIEDGRLVERGKHTELLEKRGAYYTLYMKQFRKEEDKETGGNGHKPETVPGIAGQTAA